MVPNSGKSTSRQRKSGQHLGVRLTLATGATLAVLFSAQIFASTDTTSAVDTSAAAAVVAVAPTQNSSIVLASDDSDDEINRASTTNTTTSTTSTSGFTITAAQIQPRPSTHSSR